MQPAVKALIGLGPLPISTVADGETIKSFEELIAKVRTPVFHLIETAPKWPLDDVLRNLNGEWIDRLRERAHG